MTPLVNAIPVLTKFHRIQFLGSIVSPKPGKKKKLVRARSAHQKHDYPTLENQPESLLNAAISLMSIGGISVKLTIYEESNNMIW